MNPEVILFDFNINVTSQERKQTDEDQIEIVEIVAKTPNRGFEKYILPTGAITPRATQYHGIYKKMVKCLTGTHGDKLLYHV